MPVGTSARAPGAMRERRVGRHRGEQIEAGGERALVGRQRQVCAVRQPHDRDIGVHWSSPAKAAAMRAISIAATSSLGLRRPGLDAVGRHQFDGVAVAAHDAGSRRNVVGEDPVAALARQLGAWHWRRRSRSRRQSRSPVCGRSRLRCATVDEDVGIFGERERGRRRVLASF